MIDPYKNDRPGLDEAALNAYLLTVDPGDIPVGCKLLRVYNPTATEQTVTYRTLLGNEVIFTYPANSVTFEKLRIRQLVAISDNGIEIHGFTDAALPA